jgi:hypothetical protein
MKTNSEKNLHNEGSGGLRDFDLEVTVGDMLISQYQAHMLKSRLADRLDGWWTLQQDRDRNSSSFTCDHHDQVFKVVLSINESTPADEYCNNDDRTSSSAFE